MKLKNSYILLIAMSIFLLVSIGSVCASEDLSADADSPLADDGSSVVLANESSSDTTQKIDTNIVSKDAKVRIVDKTIDVTVEDNESQPIEVAKSELKVSEGNKTLNFNYKNSQITITSNLAKGNHSLIINYIGNNVYKNSTKNIILSIFDDYTIESASSATVNQSKTFAIPLNLTDGVTINEDITGSDFKVELSYKDGNKTKTINATNLEYKNRQLVGKVTLVDKITSYNMTVTYTNETGYTTKKTGIKLNVVQAIKITPIISEADYQEGKFTFKVTDAVTGDPITNQKISISGTYNGTSIYWDLKQNGNSISISTSKSITTDSKGIATLNNANFYPGLIISSGDIYAPAGTYNLTLSGSSNLSGTLKTTIKINKIKVKVSVSPFNEYYGTTEKITVVVINAETKKPVSSVSVFFNLTNSAGKEITYTTAGANNTTVKTNYIYTNSNGTATLPVNSLAPGKYSILALLNASRNFDKAEVTKTVTIKEIPVKYTISKTGTITVTNKLTNKPVAGAIVIVTFDNNKNKVFISQTNKNGKIVFTTVGKHTITVSDKYKGEDIDLRYTGATVKKTITNKKITAKASAPKVSTYYKTDKYFTVKLTNSAKKGIYDTKLNIKVYLTSKKYYNYNGYTDISGQVRLQLNSLAPGTYKVVVTSGATKNFALKKITSKIVIKKAPTKLTPTKLTAKKGANKYFKVTVKNTKTKKVIKGVKVKIKVYTGKKYKTYTVKTNSKGIAQINVKSLKVGSHKVVVTSANKYCVAKTAKSTIKITKK